MKNGGRPLWTESLFLAKFQNDNKAEFPICPERFEADIVYVRLRLIRSNGHFFRVGSPGARPFVIWRQILKISGRCGEVKPGVRRGVEEGATLTRIANVHVSIHAKINP